MEITFTRFYTFLFLILFLSLTFFQQAYSQTPAVGAGSALVFDGVNDFVAAGMGNRGITNQVTVEAWIKTSAMEYQWVVGKYSNTQGEDAGYHLYISNGRAFFSGRDGSANYRSSGTSSTTVADNRWHHLTGVCQNGRWEIWVDGILENSVSTGNSNVKLATNLPPLTIGNYPTFNENYFRGQIDEVRIWKTGRSMAEIRKYMCQKLTGQEASLVAYFNANEPDNKILKDLSLTGANGQLQNFSFNPYAVSGAPLGDESKDFYPSDWTSLPALEILSTNKPTFQVFAPFTNAKGIHLYVVNGAPNSRSGITGGTSPDYYFGVFTVSALPAVSYTVNYKAYQTSSCYSLYKRPDNSQPSWGLLPTLNAPAAFTLNMPGESYRGEYILNTNEAPKLELTNTATNCTGNAAVLTAAGTGTGTYLWNTGSTAAAITIDKPGLYSVRFTLPGGCYSEVSRNITTGILPPFDLGRDTVVCAGISFLLKAPQGTGMTYTWQDGSTQASMLVKQEGDYWVTIRQGSCSTTSTRRVRYANCELIIPNIITPNADALNETFFIRDINPGEWALEIYNRWGKNIYRSNAYGNDWAAKDVADGIYYYKLFSADRQKTYKGYVEVIR